MRNPLFNTFPREVGIYRRLVYSSRQLQDWIEVVNGYAEPYVSLYDTNLLINMLFLDFDVPRNDFWNRLLDEVKRLYNGLRDEGYMVLPVYSGKKGFHIYIPTKSISPESISSARSILGYTQSNLITRYRLKFYDPHVIGDVRRLVRHPNTRRIHSD